MLNYCLFDGIHLPNNWNRIVLFIKVNIKSQFNRVKYTSQNISILYLP
jgi:hypothetical protein